MYWLDGLKFNAPVNTVKVILCWSVYLTIFFLGRLSPLSLLSALVHILSPVTEKMPFLNQRKRVNDHTKYLKINPARPRGDQICDHLVISQIELPRLAYI